MANISLKENRPPTTGQAASSGLPPPTGPAPPIPWAPQIPNAAPPPNPIGLGPAQMHHPVAGPMHYGQLDQSSVTTTIYNLGMEPSGGASIYNPGAPPPSANYNQLPYGPSSIYPEQNSFARGQSSGIKFQKDEL